MSRELTVEEHKNYLSVSEKVKKAIITGGAVLVINADEKNKEDYQNGVLMLNAEGGNMIKLIMTLGYSSGQAVRHLFDESEKDKGSAPEGMKEKLKTTFIESVAMGYEDEDEDEDEDESEKPVFEITLAQVLKSKNLVDVIPKDLLVKSLFGDKDSMSAIVRSFAVFAKKNPGKLGSELEEKLAEVLKAFSK